MEAPDAPHRGKGQWLPGVGFRVWLLGMALAGMLLGIGGAIDFFVGVILALFWGLVLVITMVLPISGLALWVSLRHLKRNRKRAAAAYALVPFLGAVLFVGSMVIAFHATKRAVLELRMIDIRSQVEAARQAGTRTETKDFWIDPGPPLRARYDYSVFFALTELIVYDETEDSAWAEAEAIQCRAHPIRLRGHFFQINGLC